MNRETAKKNLDVIKAFAEGKTIQSFYADNNEWRDINNPGWYETDIYRIKPQQVEVPYAKEDYYIGQPVLLAGSERFLFLISKIENNQILVESHNINWGVFYDYFIFARTFLIHDHVNKKWIKPVRIIND